MAGCGGASSSWGYGRRLGMGIAIGEKSCVGGPCDKALEPPVERCAPDSGEEAPPVRRFALRGQRGERAPGPNDRRKAAAPEHEAGDKRRRALIPLDEELRRANDPPVDARGENERLQAAVLTPSRKKNPPRRRGLRRSAAPSRRCVGRTPPGGPASSRTGRRD